MTVPPPTPQSTPPLLSIADIGEILARARGKRRTAIIAGTSKWLVAQGLINQSAIVKAAQTRGTWWPWRVLLGGLWRATLWTLGLIALLVIIGVIADSVSNGRTSPGDVLGCAACCAVPITAIITVIGAMNGLKDWHIARALCETNCTWCGYDLAGIGGTGVDAVVGVTCPECGKRDERVALAATVLTLMREKWQPALNRRWWRQSKRQDRARALRAWRTRNRWAGTDSRPFLLAGIALGSGLACVLFALLWLPTGPEWAGLPSAMALFAFFGGGATGLFIANWLLASSELRSSLGARGCPACGLGREGTSTGFNGGDCPSCGCPELRRGISIEDLLAEIYGGNPACYGPPPPPPPPPPTQIPQPPTTPREQG